MKKEAADWSLSIILMILIVVLVIAVMFLWNSHSDLKKAFEEEKNREKRVYFTEGQVELFKKDAGELCMDLCSERRYDGFVEGVLVKEGIVSFTYECTCYRIVR